MGYGRFPRDLAGRGSCEAPPNRHEGKTKHGKHARAGNDRLRSRASFRRAGAAGDPSGQATGDRHRRWSPGGLRVVAGAHRPAPGAGSREGTQRAPVRLAHPHLSRNGRLCQWSDAALSRHQRHPPHHRRQPPLGQPLGGPGGRRGSRRERQGLPAGSHHFVRDPVPVRGLRAVQRQRMGPAGTGGNGLRTGLRPSSWTGRGGAAPRPGARGDSEPVHLPDARGRAVDVEGLRRRQRCAPGRVCGRSGGAGHDRSRPGVRRRVRTVEPDAGQALRDQAIRAGGRGLRRHAVEHQDVPGARLLPAAGGDGSGAAGRDCRGRHRETQDRDLSICPQGRRRRPRAVAAAHQGDRRSLDAGEHRDRLDRRRHYRGVVRQGSGSGTTTCSLSSAAPKWW